MDLFVGQKATRSQTLTTDNVKVFGVLNALVAMDMPGPDAVFLSKNWNFKAPVFVGDAVTAAAEIREIHPTKPVTKLKITVTRQSGEVVLEGEAWCYTITPEV